MFLLLLPLLLDALVEAVEALLPEAAGLFDPLGRLLGSAAY
jgi:hypothetical protein